jgi:uncharacterized protein (DUF3084 family)
MELKQRTESRHLCELYKERGEIRGALVRMKSKRSDLHTKKEQIAEELRILKIKLKAIEIEIQWCEKSD